jgi:membrane protein implicated in regulation of membrane protease activity
MDVGWLDTLPLFDKVLWLIAVPSTTVFALLFVLRIFGLGDGHDGDTTDHHHITAGHHEGGLATGFLNTLTLTNVSIFFVALSLVGLAARYNGFGAFLSLLFALVAGASGLALNVVMWAILNRLTYDPTTKAAHTLYKTGRIYLTVPANRAGTGLMHVATGGATREWKVVTDEETDIRTGEEVVVVRTVGNTLVVARPVVSA